MKALAKACLAILILAFVSSAMAAPEKLAFRTVRMAVLKVDGRPVKLWNVFVAPEQQHRVLLQLGSRYLMLNINDREVLEVPADSLRVNGRELVWDRSRPPAAEEKKPEGEAAAAKPATTGAVKVETPLASTDWSIRDVGPARMIRLRLTAEGRQIEVQLPIQPDLRILF